MTNPWYLLFASYSGLSHPYYSSTYQRSREFKKTLSSLHLEISDFSIQKKLSQNPEWKRSLLVYFSLPS